MVKIVENLITTPPPQNEVLERVFSYLDFPDLISASQVNRAWRRSAKPFLPLFDAFKAKTKKEINEFLRTLEEIIEPETRWSLKETLKIDEKFSECNNRKDFDRLLFKLKDTLSFTLAFLNPDFRDDPRQDWRSALHRFTKEGEGILTDLDFLTPTEKIPSCFSNIFEMAHMRRKLHEGCVLFHVNKDTLYPKVRECYKEFIQKYDLQTVYELASAEFDKELFGPILEMIRDAMKQQSVQWRESSIQQAREGDFEKAQNTFEKIVNNDDRDSALYDFTIQFSGKGDFSKAKEFAEKISNPRLQERAKKRIADVQSEQSQETLEDDRLGYFGRR